MAMTARRRAATAMHGGFPKAVAAAAAVKEGGSQVQRQAIVTM